MQLIFFIYTIFPSLFIRFAEANEWSQVYGMMLLPVAIAFCAYALYMYTKRAAMIRRKDPGPCELLVLVVYCTLYSTSMYCCCMLNYHYYLCIVPLLLFTYYSITTTTAT